MEAEQRALELGYPHQYKPIKQQPTEILMLQLLI